MGRIGNVQRRLDEDLPRLAAAHDVPGVSVAVLVDGQVVEGTAGDVFVRTDPAGAAVRAAKFLGADATGRVRFLHTGRAAPRID